MTKKEYNNEPIFYCKNCLSLSIIKDDIEEVDVCKICGSIESARSSFVEWEDKFINTYGNNYMSIPNKEFKKMVTWL